MPLAWFSHLLVAQCPWNCTCPLAPSRCGFKRTATLQPVHEAPAKRACPRTLMTCPWSCVCPALLHTSTTFCATRSLNCSPACVLIESRTPACLWEGTCRCMLACTSEAVQVRILGHAGHSLSYNIWSYVFSHEGDIPASYAVQGCRSVFNTTAEFDECVGRATNKIADVVRMTREAQFGPEVARLSLSLPNDRAGMLVLHTDRTAAQSIQVECHWIRGVLSWRSSQDNVSGSLRAIHRPLQRRNRLTSELLRRCKQRSRTCCAHQLSPRRIVTVPPTVSPLSPDHAWSVSPRVGTVWLLLSAHLVMLQDVHASLAAVGSDSLRTAGERYGLSQLVKQLAPCNILVWGVSSDSVAWDSMNRGGVTTFVEDVYDSFDPAGMVRLSSPL